MITVLPPSIRYFRHLQKLAVSDNKLKNLPVALGSLTSLTELILSHNELAGILPVVGNLAFLRSLDLSHNCLRTLPQSIGKADRQQLPFMLDLHAHKGV